MNIAHKKLNCFLILCHVKVAVYDMTIINCEVFVRKQNYQTYCSIIKFKINFAYMVMLQLWIFFSIPIIKHVGDTRR